MSQPTPQRTKHMRKHRTKRTRQHPELEVGQHQPNPLFDVSKEVIVEETQNDEPSSSLEKGRKRERKLQPITNTSSNNTSELEIVKPNPQDTNPQSSTQQELRPPYQFLFRKQSPFHTVIVPHFTWKSINFFLCLSMVLASVTLFVVYALMTKKPVSWSCLLFTTQSKFYPRLRYDYELWRIVVSSIFHGNISHFVLNIVGLQLYGYFVEWYYGKWKFTLALVLAIINSHLMSCLTDGVNVSSTASGVLYAILGMKAVFFFKYRNYQPLGQRKLPLYGLLALITAVNLIVLFIGSNVDYGSHVGGLITGLLCGLMFYDPSTPTFRTKAIKITAIVLASLLSISLVLGCFLTDNPFYKDVNSAISSLC